MFKVGTKIKIIDAGSGAQGINGATVTVTNKNATDGIFNSRDGFNVVLKSGKVWRVNAYGKYEVIEKPTFTKSDLKSGDKVVYRNGEGRFVLVETGTLHDTRGEKCASYRDFEDDLTSCAKWMVIMKVYRNGVLIWQRNEETPEQIEIEKIEKDMRKLADRLAELKG